MILVRGLIWVLGAMLVLGMLCACATPRLTHARPMPPMYGCKQTKVMPITVDGTCI